MMENIKRQMVELYNVPCNMYNVGCMKQYMEYRPKTLEQIISAADNGLRTSQRRKGELIDAT